MFNIKWGVVAAGTAFVLALLLSLTLAQVPFLIALLRALIFAVAFFALGTGAWVLISSFLPDLLVPSSGGEDMTDVFSSGAAPGSRVNITVGNATGAALPDSRGGMYGVEEVGDISDLISGKLKQSEKDMDQTRPGGYNGGEGGGFSPDFSAFDGAAAAAEAGTAAGTEAGTDVFGDFGGFDADDGTAAGTEAGTDGAAGTGGGGKAPEPNLGGYTGKAGITDGIFDDGDIFSSASIYSSGGEDPFGDDRESDEPERKSVGNKAQEFDGDFNPKEIAAGLRTVLQRDKKG